MEESSIKSPGVYVNEANAFPNSVVAVPTAVPAFIGYTPTAAYGGKSYTNTPVRITSMAAFEAYFCLKEPDGTTSRRQYDPQYYLVAQKSQPDKGDYLQIDGTCYSILPDPNTIYYLYNSIRLFFENGGSMAYIVSVGTYGASSGNPIAPGDAVVNPNVVLRDLQNGLETLFNEQEPTMYICPEATLLSVAENSTLMETMLSQSSSMGTSISIFDVIGGNSPDPNTFMNDIATFRNGTGMQGLDYGAAYYPFVGTTIMGKNDIDYTNLFNGDIARLAAIINPPAHPDPRVASLLATIGNPESGMTELQNHMALMNASQAYAQIIDHVLGDANLLPPSGGIAGVITTTDNEIGPWQAPANRSIVGVSSLPITLSDTQQGGLNIDAVSGKSVNAIRSFNGIGILVWGARTLDGNSNDWRYISTRRTMIFIEQSCKLAAQAYVFAPNDKNTWEAVVAMISSFLTGIWKQGGLMGASAADAFSVSCGLGTTMTADDILNGYMNVQVNVAITHPAEFIVITFQQQMASAD